MGFFLDSCQQAGERCAFVRQHASQVRRTDDEVAGRTHQRRSTAGPDRAGRADNDHLRLRCRMLAWRPAVPTDLARPRRSPRGDLRGTECKPTAWTLPWIHHPIRHPRPSTTATTTAARHCSPWPARRPTTPRRCVRRRGAAAADRAMIGADWTWLSLPRATWPGRDSDRSHRPVRSFDLSVDAFFS